MIKNNCAIQLCTIAVVLLLYTRCSDDIKENKNIADGSATRFELLTKDNSGFYFQNELRESEDLNILTYQYLYNGGGVAVGDLDNDGLEDIFMVGNLFGGRVYKNLGNLQFRQMSETANVFCDGFSSGVTMVDINEDGWLDIYICRTLSSTPTLRGNILLINNKDFTFTNRASEYGLDDKGFSTHASFFDYDRDGDLDVFVLNHRYDFANALNILENYETDRIAPFNDSIIYYGSNRLYKNEGNGKFTDVSKTARVNDFAFGLSATVSDINNDGWPDIYVANDFYDKDRLYINSGKGYFVDSLAQFIGLTSRNSMGCDIADFNNDGLVDIFVPDMMAEDNLRQKQLKGPTTYDIYQAAARKGYYHQVMRNTLQLNNGNGTFTEIGQYSGVSHTDWSWAPIFEDINNDGWKDLFITNGYYRDVTDMDYVKYDSPQIRPDQKAETFQLVQKGKINPVSNYLYTNSANLQFEDQTAQSGLNAPTHSQGAVFCDLDHDGDQDLIVNNLHQPSMLYANRSERDSVKNNWLQLATAYNTSNPNGIGSKVYVYSNGTFQLKEMYSSRGYLSASAPLLHFGVGTQQRIDSTIVKWPDGKTEQFGNVQINQRTTLKYGTGKATMLKSSSSILSNAQWRTEDLNSAHQESKYIDFKNDPLLEFNYSESGPHVVSGDINGDNLEDVLIGGSAGQPTQLLVQRSSGKFEVQQIEAFAADKKFEDGKLVLLDADGDKDLDLFITSCDFEGLSELHQPRLYRNDGKGKFTRDQSALPAINSYNYSAAAGDFDGDGDQDIFIGGSYRYNSYPLSDASFLLTNNGGKFTKAPLLTSASVTAMITDGVAADLNKDKIDDLILVGEWTGIHVLIGSKTGFTDKSKDYGVDTYTGMWSALYVADINLDGQLDIVAGNRGTNTFFKPRNKVAARLYYHDFDNNGKLDPLPMFPFKDGVRYPKHTLDVLFTQLPKVRKVYNRYALFSSANEQTVLSGLGNAEAPYLEASNFESMLLLREGNKFTPKTLPAEIQFGPVNGIAIYDVDKDDRPDLLFVGNRNHSDVENGRCTGFGLRIVLNKASGFQSYAGPFQKWTAFKDLRSIAVVKGKSEASFVLTENNGRAVLIAP